MIDKSRSRPIKFVIGVILFAYLSYFISDGAVGIDLLDVALTSLVQISNSGIWTVFYKVIAWLASPGMDILWIVILAFLMYVFKYKIQAFWTLAYMVGAMALGFIVKHIIGRARPIGQRDYHVDCSWVAKLSNGNDRQVGECRMVSIGHFLTYLLECTLSNWYDWGRVVGMVLESNHAMVLRFLGTRIIEMAVVLSLIFIKTINKLKLIYYLAGNRVTK